MKTFLTLILPFLGLLLNGNIFWAALMLVLQCTIIGWPFAAIIALFVISDTNSKRRHKQLLKAVAN